MKIKVSVFSSVGIKLKVNQDNFYVNGFINKNCKNRIKKTFFATSKEQVLAICDGMGGESDGEKASLISVKKIIQYKSRYSSLSERFEEHADVIVKSANKALCEYMEDSSVRVGSTIAMLCVDVKKEEATAMNVGDSKVILCRDDNIIKLSRDHNQAQTLVEMGIISEEEARVHKDKSKLTQHLGIMADEMIIEPYISDTVMLKKGDMFVLCSDGLTDALDNDDIKRIINSRKRNIAKRLVNEAEKNNSKDNITVICAKVI